MKPLKMPGWGQMVCHWEREREREKEGEVNWGEGKIEGQDRGKEKSESKERQIGSSVRRDKTMCYRDRGQNKGRKGQKEESEIKQSNSWERKERGYRGRKEWKYEKEKGQDERKEEQKKELGIHCTILETLIPTHTVRENHLRCEAKADDKWAHTDHPAKTWGLTLYG